MPEECKHATAIRDVVPSALGCEECLKIHSQWVHLRLCRTCGHVGCCDDSPNRHATRHFHADEAPDHRGLRPARALGLVLRRRDRLRPLGPRNAAAGAAPALRLRMGRPALPRMQLLPVLPEVRERVGWIRDPLAVEFELAVAEEVPLFALQLEGAEAVAAVGHDPRMWTPPGIGVGPSTMRGSRVSKRRSKSVGAVQDRAEHLVVPLQTPPRAAACRRRPDHIVGHAGGDVAFQSREAKPFSKAVANRRKSSHGLGSSRSPSGRALSSVAIRT